MQKLLFDDNECDLILKGLENSIIGPVENKWYRKYEEFLILDKNILELILDKIKIFGVKKIKDGRILKYEKGSFTVLHEDTTEKKPHRYKTVIIQLSSEKDYEGGNMIFGNEILSKKRGTTAIFDSKTLHGLELIEFGVRYSFVIWLDREDMGISKGII